MKSHAVGHAQDFVMTAATAEVACPAAPARLLGVNMRFGQPGVLADPIDARREVTHRPIGVFHEPVAGRQVALGRNSEVARTRAAGIRAMRPPMQLAESVNHIQERVPFPLQHPTLEHEAAGDQVFKHMREVRVRAFPPRRSATGAAARTLHCESPRRSIHQVCGANSYFSV